MKGIICYYSGSGNTKLACDYLKHKVNNAGFELYDIVKNGVPDFGEFDIVGFATFTDYWGPPKLMYSFIENISNQNNKKAFVLTTYGAISGKMTKLFSDLVESVGFDVITGFSLHTPENFPPMRKMGLASDKAPKDRDVRKFDAFIADLDTIINDIEQKNEIRKRKPRVSLLARVLPVSDRNQSKKDFGVQNVNEELCTECGVCMKGCPYEAIEMDPKPIFDHGVCAGCWYCYNHCKQKAIYTKKFSGDHQYPRPNDNLKSKLAVNK